MSNWTDPTAYNAPDHDDPTKRTWREHLDEIDFNEEWRTEPEYRAFAERIIGDVETAPHCWPEVMQLILFVVPWVQHLKATGRDVPGFVKPFNEGESQ